MKIKIMLILAIIGMIGLSGITLSAAQSVTFLHDGNAVTDTIVDMSSNTGQVEFRRSPKLHKSRNAWNRLRLNTGGGCSLSALLYSWESVGN